MRIKGIDMSYCQAGINIASAVKDGNRFAIIRAGIADCIDTEFANNYMSAKKAEVDYGYYWYVTALTADEAIKQAEKCLEVISGTSPNYPVYCDIEEQEQIDKLDTDTRTEIVIAFCEKIRAGGYYPALYCNPSWLENYLHKDKLLPKYDLWLAAWTENPDIATKYNYGHKIWQWGVDKIDGYNVDGDICYVDYPSIIKPTEVDKAENKNQIIGRTLQLKNTPLYVSAESKEAVNCLTGTYYVYDDKIVNSRCRITCGKNRVGKDPVSEHVTGWISVYYLSATHKAETEPVSNAVKVGDTVKVKGGATSYNGLSLATYVYTQVYDVMQVGTAGKSDYIVIGQGGQVTAGVKAGELIKV